MTNNSTKMVELTEKTRQNETTTQQVIKNHLAKRRTLFHLSSTSPCFHQRIQRPPCAKLSPFKRVSPVDQIKSQIHHNHSHITNPLNCPRTATEAFPAKKSQVNISVEEHFLQYRWHPMAFASRFSNTQLLKRGRNAEKYAPDGVYGQRFNAGFDNVFKRHCSNKNRVAEFGGLVYEEEDDDMIFACYQPYLNGVLREETADSETCSSKVYYDSDDFSPPFCRSNSDSAASVLRLPVPEDAQSSTSDSCCCCCCDTSDEDDDDDEEDDNQGESSSSSSSISDSTQSLISYLFEASDDDLGLPPPTCSSNVHCDQSNVTGKHVDSLDLDLDLGLDLDLDLDVADDQLLNWNL